MAKLAIGAGFTGVIDRSSGAGTRRGRDRVRRRRHGHDIAGWNDRRRGTGEKSRMRDSVRRNVEPVDVSAVRRDRLVMDA